jgi:hypothetical protein
MTSTLATLQNLRTFTFNNHPTDLEEGQLAFNLAAENQNLAKGDANIYMYVGNGSDKRMDEDGTVLVPTGTSGKGWIRFRLRNMNLEGDDIYGDLSVVNANLSVTGGNSSVSNGNLSVTSGNSSVTNGSLSVTNGNASVTNGSLSVTNGNTLISNGNLSVTDGDITLTNGDLTVINSKLAVTSQDGGTCELLIPTQLTAPNPASDTASIRWNTQSSILQAWNGTKWDTTAKVTVSGISPPDPSAGDMWFDPDSLNFYVYVIPTTGPAYWAEPTSGGGGSGLYAGNGVTANAQNEIDTINSGSF